MLVKLTSSASGEIIMFAKDAHQLFEIIGKERTARGVFTKEQLPEARAKLQHAVDEEKSALREAERRAREGGVVDEHEKEDDEDHKSGRVGINLGQRAHPLIHMMELTQKEEGFIVWEAPGDF